MDCWDANHNSADYETDTIIQSSLRSQLQNDVTVITVAHRLQTIMDADKIVSSPFFHCLFTAHGDHLTLLQMVLDAGQLVRFPNPLADDV
jgi:ABC-type transport system involved in Fe-S cluster assembly fused permease/ATPase subunit